MSLNISKQLTRSNLKKSLKKNKKAVIKRQRLTELDYIMDDKQKALALLDKYVKVLSGIEGHQEGVKEISAPGYEKCFKCSCPNHEAHNTHYKNGKIVSTPNQNHKMKIGVVKSDNPEKFGEYMVTYVCWAYRSGSCTNDQLSIIFKEKFGLSSDARFFRKEPQPTVFPRNDMSFLDVKGMGKHAQDWHAYTGFAEETYFVEYRFESLNKTGGKSFVPISYSPLLADGEYPDIKGEGGFIGKMLWDPPYPPYKLHQVSKMWQKANNRKFLGAIINEGCAKSNVQEQLLPEYWCTSLYNAKSKWQQSSFEVFKQFPVVYTMPDNDSGSKDAFHQLALHLKKEGINVKEVKLPNDILPDTWDVKDGFPEGVTIDDYKQWIDEAETPIERDPLDFSNIKEDANNGRHVHLEDDKYFHYDRYTRKINHNHNLNLWYKRDITTRDLRGRPISKAVDYLHQVGCKVVKGVAYRPIDKEFLWEGNHEYVNSYIPFKPEEISKEEFDIKKIEPFLFQIKLFTNFNEEEFNFFFDKLAYSQQFPEKNIKFGTLIISDREGAGKSYVWSILFKLYGGLQYVAMIRSNDIFMQFKPWMANRSIVICDEVKIEGSKKEQNKQADDLKGIITEEIHMVEPKGVNPYSVRNIFTLFMSSNHSGMQFLKDHDTRRYFVMKQFMKRQHVRNKYPNHYDDLVAMSEDDEAIKHLRHYLKHEWKISDHFLNEGFYEPLKTEAFHNIVKENQSQLHKNLEKVRRAMPTGTPFETPIHRVEEVYEWCLKQDKDKADNYWNGISENEIRSFFKNTGEQLNKGNDIPNMYGGGYESDRTRGWFATGEYAERIADLKPMQWRYIRQKKLILSELFKKENQQDMFNDTEVSDDPILKKGTDND
jgi:hypothetical protein